MWSTSSACVTPARLGLSSWCAKRPLSPRPHVLSARQDFALILPCIRPGQQKQRCTRVQITQMKFRLSEGDGECFYYVGVEDGGYPRGLCANDLRLSLNNLDYMAQSLKATATIAELPRGAHGRAYALVHVRRNTVAQVHYVELRVAGAAASPVPLPPAASCSTPGVLRQAALRAVGGSVDSGKSTLVGVLTHGLDGAPSLDDGAGRARTSVFRHKHEVQTGHTSSISQAMVGYDADGAVLNYVGVNRLTAAEISAAAGKLLHFLDLCGHPRYLKTALYGAPPALAAVGARRKVRGIREASSHALIGTHPCFVRAT